MVIFRKKNGYGISFEAYVALSRYEFYKNYDPNKDRVWVAEHQDKIVGFFVGIKRKQFCAAPLFHP
ncbi:MAG: hypothetical protein ABIQ31_11795 [Ferruginibacter sp.]